MSNKAVGSILTQVLPGNIKASFSGAYNYEPVGLSASSGEGWIYAEKDVTTTEADLLGVTEDFMGGSSGVAGNITTADKIPWIYIKNTATTNGKSETTHGVMLNLDGTNETIAFNSTTSIFLGPNDSIILKMPNTTVAEFHARTVATVAGKPSAAGTENVRLIIAAIIQNVA